MLITEQSLVETLDGRAGDLRRRCRLFIPHQAVFIPNQLLFSPRLICSHPADRLPGRSGPPCGPRKGDHGGIELKPEPSRPAVWATGLIDGTPECALACAAGMTPCRRAASQPEGLPTALLRPWRLAPTTHRQRWPDPYPRRSRARLRQCRRCLNRARPTGPHPIR